MPAARGAKGADEEGYRAEFIRLVELAELMKGVEIQSPAPATRNGKKTAVPDVVEVDI